MLVRKFLPCGREPYRKSLKNPAKTLPGQQKHKIDTSKKQHKTPVETLSAPKKTPTKEFSDQ